MKVDVVRGRADRARFIDLPWKIYLDDPNWVPPLKASVRELLDTARHPFYDSGKGAEAELFVAWEGPDVVGRVAAILNHKHNQVHEENVVFFTNGLYALQITVRWYDNPTGTYDGLDYKRRNGLSALIGNDFGHMLSTMQVTFRMGESKGTAVAIGIEKTDHTGDTRLHRRPPGIPAKGNGAIGGTVIGSI